MEGQKEVRGGKCLHSDGLCGDPCSECCWCGASDGVCGPLFPVCVASFSVGTLRLLGAAPNGSISIM